MKWIFYKAEPHDECYGDMYQPIIPNISDETHDSGRLEGPDKEVCTVCRTTGQCIHFSNHREVDTDEIDLFLCSQCLEKGQDILKKFSNKEETK